MLTEDFLKNSWNSVKTLVERAKRTPPVANKPKVTFFRFRDSQKVTESFEGNHFFLRGSVEYTNPQLTVEEVQGIVGARLLEVAANYFCEAGLHQPEEQDVTEICDRMKKPPVGQIMAFLLNTDDTEPDRYSMNPLKESIMSTGQSAFPAANVRTDNLTLDRDFVKRYEGTLICQREAELIETQLRNSNGSYLDFVDSVKYAQLEKLSPLFGMDLSLYALRMPLTTLRTESKSGLLHHIISETHRDFETVKQAYDCMGRSISKRTTLLTVPHSKLGHGSKRAARGKLHFTDNKLESLSIKPKTNSLSMENS
jgi:YD repeat-containing protein